MSNILAVLKRLPLLRRSVASRTPDPESLSLRDWADLPAYHPRNDRAPC